MATQAMQIKTSEGIAKARLFRSAAPAKSAIILYRTFSVRDRRLIRWRNGLQAIITRCCSRTVFTATRPTALSRPRPGDIVSKHSS